MRAGKSVWFWVRTHRKTYAAIIALVFGLQMVAIYSRLTSTTAVTTQDAVAAYREAQAEADQAAAQAEAAEPAAAPAVAQAAGPKTSGKSGAAPASQPECDWVCPTTFTAPERGVYEYFQCGLTTGQCTGAETEPPGRERFEAFSRDFPRRGQRTITVTGSRTWNNVHDYAEEHREEFDLAVDESGVYNSRYKVDIKVGPLPGGSDYHISPPMKLSQWPMREGLTWSGDWVDADSHKESEGHYDCKVVAKEEINVGGTKLRTWVVEMHLTLKGEVSGDVTVKLWLQPELRNTVQESYRQTLSTPQGGYEAYYMATLANATPTR